MGFWKWLLSTILEFVTMLPQKLLKLLHNPEFETFIGVVTIIPGTLVTLLIVLSNPLFRNTTIVVLLVLLQLVIGFLLCMHAYYRYMYNDC